MDDADDAGAGGGADDGAVSWRPYQQWQPYQQSIHHGAGGHPLHSRRGPASRRGGDDAHEERRPPQRRARAVAAVEHHIGTGRDETRRLCVVALPADGGE